MNSITVFLMSCAPRFNETIGGPQVSRYRPALDTAADHYALLTDSEEATLRRRVAAYLETCRQRRIAESSEVEVGLRLRPWTCP